MPCDLLANEGACAAYRFPKRRVRGQFAGEHHCQRAARAVHRCSYPRLAKNFYAVAGGKGIRRIAVEVTSREKDGANATRAQLRRRVTQRASLDRFDVQQCRGFAKVGRQNNAREGRQLRFEGVARTTVGEFAAAAGGEYRIDDGGQPWARLEGPHHRANARRRRKRADADGSRTLPRQRGELSLEELRRDGAQRDHAGGVLCADRGDGGEDPALLCGPDDEIAPHARDVPRMSRAD